MHGEKQEFDVHQFNLSNEFKKEFNNRLVLIYTGQRRLAKNLLREIMSSYISNSKKSLDIIYTIKNMAKKIKNDLDTENLNSFAKHLSEHWELNKQLDAGCTNTCINQILLSCDDLVEGLKERLKYLDEGD